MKMPGNTGFAYPRNAPLVTGGGLVFLATGGERKVRAYDRDNGKELWVRDLPSGSEGMPATYEVNGRQFIVFPVATAGGQFMANYNQPPRGAGPGPEAAAVQGAGAAAPDAGGRGGRGGRAGRGGGGQAGPPGAYIAFALPR
jgi:quinoprotein glucose dehydrogenase